MVKKKTYSGDTVLKDNIRDMRKEKGYTQSQLASLIGVTQGAVYFWEKGINEPAAGYVVRLAEVFGVSADELLSYECEKSDDKTTRTAEMTALFNKLTENQQNIIINTAKEMLKP